MLHVILSPTLKVLYFYISTFHRMCAVPHMAVFCSSSISCFTGMWLRYEYILNYFEIVPCALVITGITFVFAFNLRCISVVRSLYFTIFYASFFVSFISPEILTRINRHVPFSLPRIMTSGLLLMIVLSVCTFWFHNMVTLPS
jgi:hypothetical protein